MALKVGTVVDKLADYRVEVVLGNKINEFDTPTGEYALISNKYGVVEAQTPMLPQALEYLEQLQAGLDARRDIKEDQDGSKAAVVDLVAAKEKVH